MARIALSKKTRFEVFKRDGFACQYCGATPPKVILHVDHIHPVAEGGTNDQDNLVTSCESCNQGKGARLLSSTPMPLADKAALVAEAEEQLRGFNEVMEAKRARVENDCWRVAELWMKASCKSSIHKSDFQSIRNFINKLGLHECLEAMEIAVGRKPWGGPSCFRYFCGICWSKIKEASASA